MKINKDMDKEFISIQMVIFIMVVGISNYFMAKVFICSKPDKFLMVF